VSYFNKDYDYRLQPQDVLSVRIKSIETGTSDYLNLEANGSLGSFNGQMTTFLTGFSISDSGYIHLPKLGKLKVGGLTVEESRALIQRRVDEELVDATAIVNLVSFKVSVLGEVASPGYFHIYNNRATILEALAMAGGLNEFANRQEVVLIRQRENGSDAVLLDLTSPDLPQSPYYYLKPNDIVNVRALNVKNQRSNLANLNIFNVSFAAIGTAVSVISLLQLIKQSP